VSQALFFTVDIPVDTYRCNPHGCTLKRELASATKQQRNIEGAHLFAAARRTSLKGKQQVKCVVVCQGRKNESMKEEQREKPTCLSMQEEWVQGNPGKESYP